MVARKTRRTPGRRSFRQSFQLRQQAAGDYNAATSDYIAGASIDINMIGSIQPATGQIVNQLPENERQVDNILVVTDGIDQDSGDLIKAKSVRFGDADQTQGDIVLHDGFLWIVRKVLDYGLHGHQEILAVKIGGQDG